MGYDAVRFQGEVDEELICPICSSVLEDPRLAPECEHAFCADCIHEWLSRQQTCPVDRRSISIAELKPVPRILKNLLSRLEIRCDNESYGCTTVVKLDILHMHLKECEHNPKKPVACTLGCGITVPKDEMVEHNCVKELRGVVRDQGESLSKAQQDISDMRYALTEQKREIQQLKETLRGIRMGDRAAVGGVTGHTRGLGTEADDEIVRWAGSLPRARVTRWGGMISTPDAVLQAMIKRSLQESGSPAHIVNELMENAHERRWPPGLQTLETRQMNRRQYEQYTARRIPGKQAVIVMACDNTHISDDMILEPGLVMIFAHGIE